MKRFAPTRTLRATLLSWLIAATMLASLVVVLAHASRAREGDARAAQLESALESIRADGAEVDRSMDALSEQLADAEERLAALNSSRARTGARARALREEIERVEAEIAAAQAAAAAQVEDEPPVGVPRPVLTFRMCTDRVYHYPYPMPTCWTETYDPNE